MANIWLVIATARDSSGSETVLRFSSDVAYYDSSLNEFLPVISNALTFNAEIVNNLTTYGQSRTGFGILKLFNADGRLDYLDDYGFDGGPIRMLYGDPSADIGEFVEVFSGVMEQPTPPDFEEIQIRLRDKQAILDLPVSENEFAGTNSGPTGEEGTESDIGGKSKPRVFGVVFNVKPPRINSSRLLYAVSYDKDGDRTSVDSLSVYVGGVEWTSDGDYADLAALDAASITTGRYSTCLAEGLFKLGSSPPGEVTCDIVESGTSADNQLPRLIERLIEDAGGTVRSGDIALLQQTSAYDAGVWIYNGETYHAALDKLAESDFIFYSPTRTGEDIFTVSRLNDGNILVEQNDLSDSSWTKTETTISADDDTSPDGSVSADNVVPSTNSTVHSVEQTPVAAAYSGDCSISGYFKANGYSQVELFIDNGSNEASAIFDIDAGSFVSQIEGGVFEISKTLVDHISDEWFYCLVCASAPTGSEITMGFRVADNGSSSFAGDGSSGILAWRVNGTVGDVPDFTLVEIGNGVDVLADEYGLLDSMKRKASNDPGRGVPAYKCDVGWRYNPNVQTEASVDTNSISEDRVDFLKLDYRSAIAVADSSVKNKHPNSPIVKINTTLANQSDAELVASRGIDLFSEERRIWVSRISMDLDLMPKIYLGKPFDVKIDRYGMGIRKRFVIIGIVYDADSFEYEITHWG